MTMQMNDCILSCKDHNALVSRLETYFTMLSDKPCKDICLVNETISLMVELFESRQLPDCAGYVHINNIIHILLLEDVSFCVNYQRDVMLSLKDYLIIIICQSKESLCPGLIDSSCRLLSLLSLEGLLTVEENKLLNTSLNSRCESHQVSILKQMRPSWLLPVCISVIVLVCSISLSPVAWYIHILFSLILILLSSILIYSFYRSHIRKLQHSIGRSVPHSCNGKHVTVMTLLFGIREKHERQLIDPNAPAKIQVGERVFNSGEEAIQLLGDEIMANLKTENKSVASKVKEEEPAVQTVTNPLSFNQIMQQAMQPARDTPFFVSDTLRRDLENLVAILEKNGKNPALLKKAREDLIFMDTVVTKHVVK